MYPFSQDKYRYDRLIEVLSLYRLTLGHPRQEDLVKSLKTSAKLENIDKMYINLSPFLKYHNA